jgi:hypothetical protein
MHYATLRRAHGFYRLDPWAATAALGGGKIHGPSLGDGIMYHYNCHTAHPLKY